MAKTIAFVLLRLIATLFAVTFLTFLMVALLPGDPVDTILGTGPRAPGIEEQIRDDLNLDDPFIVRYFTWLGDAVTGDLGTSYVTDQPVSDTIQSRLPVTAQLAFMSIFIAVVVAIPVGVLGAYKQGKWPDTVSSAGVQVALSIPNFVFGIFLIWLFCGAARLAPGIELEPSQRRSRRQHENRDHAGVGARARPDGVVLAPRAFRHDGHTARELHPLGPSQGPQRPLHPVPPCTAAQFAQLDDHRRHQLRCPARRHRHHRVTLRAPGLGFSLIAAINGRDILVIQGITVFIAAMFVIINTIVDLLYAVLDPRIRRK